MTKIFNRLTLAFKKLTEVVLLFEIKIHPFTDHPNQRIKALATGKYL